MIFLKIDILEFFSSTFIAYSCKSTFQTFKILTSEIETSRLDFSTSENAIHVQNAISDLEISFFNLKVDFLNLQVWKLYL